MTWRWGWLVLACAFWCAGDSVFAAPEAVSPFPTLAGISAPALLSATASLQLGWVEEGERRRWFRDQERDAVLVKVSSLLKVKAGASAGRWHVDLPGQDACLGLSVEPALENSELLLRPGQEASLQVSYFTFLHRQPNPPLTSLDKARRGAGKASYVFRILSPLAGMPGDLSLDFGRSLTARWFKLEPAGGKLVKRQKLLLSPAGPDYVFTISDGILKHYPAMSLKQKRASMALAEECARRLNLR